MPFFKDRAAKGQLDILRLLACPPRRSSGCPKVCLYLPLKLLSFSGPAWRFAKPVVWPGVLQNQWSGLAFRITTLSCMDCRFLSILDLLASVMTRIAKRLMMDWEECLCTSSSKTFCAGKMVQTEVCRSWSMLFTDNHQLDIDNQ